MSFWKIMTGAVIGVGAIAAAPFTGGGSLLGAATLMGSLAGAGTIAAAVSAGVVGAGIGACMDGEEEAESRGEDKGRAKAKAEYSLKVDKMNKEFQQITGKYQETEQYFKLIIAMQSVGMACAACDGSISPEERVEIDEFIAGISSVVLPAHIQNEILEIYNNPPNIKTAFKLAYEAAPNNLELFDEIVEIIMHADNHVHVNEKVFLSSWNQLRIAA